MPYAVTLAIVADRFDCVPAVARELNGRYKFKWPLTSGRPYAGADVEQLLRQKVLVSWLLAHPLRMQQATRELIVRGSSLWGVFREADDDDDDGRGPSAADRAAAWWNLPEGLEHELQYRRECILNTVASVQRHFLRLYASRDRQCKLGYDSSAACDAFQLGQMLKFLIAKELLFLVDFGPASLDIVPDTSLLDVDELLATLKQCPNYQVDKHHTNCGPQIRIKAIMDYIRSMLSANAVCISHHDWSRRRAEATWVEPEDKTRLRDEDGRPFSFTRAIANDQRLQYEGALHADRMARSLFTATSWDWTPEA
ncbi:hypothetical protein CDD83_8251 [Cordyceps sp. RAO-2017]|nr:hypothetical protein CDD83_8251 [Cordyceps sp. RAO-2017]